ncbi:MAG: aldo/keto reductase [Aigarchaeota archaeon]|nr:aldo/keto reductase [Candidatus Wolframiiraptor gerlachensis]
MVMEYRFLGKTGERIAAIGLGTWLIGGGGSPDYSRDREAVEAIRYAIELGMTHIDTAEMYGGGHAEELVGEAIKAFKRDEVFIASKVWPTNLRYDDLLKACERSLKRLQTSYIDLYYIHWPSDVIPLSESMRAMERLYKDGKIRYIGLSNFSPTQIEEARSYLSTTDVVAIQAEYSLYNRKIEADLIPYCFRNGMTAVAYSPLARGALLADLKKPTERRIQLLMELAEKYSKTPVQIALNWVIWHDQVIAIPKALQRQHLEENAGAAGWKLAKEDYDMICKAW